MSWGINQVTIAGYLGKDPETRNTPGGASVVAFSVATTRKWKNDDGSKGEETTWMNVEFWGKRGAAFAEYHHKGSPCFIQGRLKRDNWEDKQTGAKRTDVKIVAESFEFVPNGQGGHGGNQQQGNDQGQGFDYGHNDQQQNARPAPQGRQPPPQRQAQPQRQQPQQQMNYQGAPDDSFSASL